MDITQVNNVLLPGDSAVAAARQWWQCHSAMVAAAWLQWRQQLGGSSGSAAAVVVGSSSSGISASNSTIFCVPVGWERGKSSSSGNGSGTGNSAIVCSNMIRRGGICHGTSNHGRGGGEHI